jgi:hypothetical protein
MFYDGDSFSSSPLPNSMRLYNSPVLIPANQVGAVTYPSTREGTQFGFRYFAGGPLHIVTFTANGDAYIPYP